MNPKHPLLPVLIATLTLSCTPHPTPLTQPEALTFLQTYMPLGDRTDYPDTFYINNIRSSFQARQAMPWGDSIPEEIFNHFVLPIRVNNENMDESRMVFYAELKPRVEKLSLKEAILEVNHWCHEKAVYTPSDSRTSSPLATVRTAYGRCGEESVLLVAALRAVSIPARQVYTPRWAHTDDNHAWVEAWADGQWYFLGACEPEPVLNMAWFNEPASRGMLMHTKVFGKYHTDDEIISETACYTEINVTKNYAKVAKMNILVVDEVGRPVEGALVEFKLYNYAEFYTVASRESDAQGCASLTAGWGDMLVWASSAGRFGFSKVSCGRDAETIIKLDKRPGEKIEMDIDLVPPPSHPIPALATEEQRKENTLRLQHEDSIRNAYVETFCDEKDGNRFLTASRGNWREIKDFLEQAARSKDAITLLDVISQKDLRDTPASVLFDHLTHCSSPQSDFEARYILNPRVDNELLSPYRSFFSSAFKPERVEKFRTNPQMLVEWVRDSITIHNELNPQSIPMLPKGVWTSRTADSHSRDIFFVALARSLYIPARINPVDGFVQYNKGKEGNEEWITVSFSRNEETNTQSGTVSADYAGDGRPVNPQYYNHFTIASISNAGRLSTLDFSGNQAGDTWNDLLRNPLALEQGNYILVTGMRMAKGNVLARIQSFHVAAGALAKTNLIMRRSNEELQVQGNIDAEATYIDAETRQPTSILNTTGRGYFIIGRVRPGYEPCTHALRDIAAQAEELQKWGRSIILLFEDETYYRRFHAKEYGNLPSNVCYGIDQGGRIARMIDEGLNLKEGSDLPVFILADTFGRIVYSTQGYTIGLGEQLIKAIHLL